MKHVIVKVLPLAVLACALTACACPRLDSYDRVPYVEERTAGSGVEHYEGKCRVAETQVQQQEMRSAEPVFQTKVRK